MSDWKFLVAVLALTAAFLYTQVDSQFESNLNPSQSKHNNLSPPPNTQFRKPSSSGEIWGQHVLDEHRNWQERTSELYQLTRGDESSVPMLQKIVESKVPDLTDNNAHLRSQELSLRVTAMAALDKLAKNSPSAAKALLTLAEQPMDPTLATLVQISLSGIKENRPGKLNRFIQKLTGEELVL